MKDFDCQSIFLNSKERFVCSLGNNYLQNFLAGGGLQKGFAVLSDKRVYFKGDCFVRSGKRFSKSTEERVVDVKDITGSGFISTNPIWALIVSIYFIVNTFIALLISIPSISLFANSEDLGIMFLPVLFGVVISGIFYYIYISKKHNFFQIQYAGGVIAFETKWYGVNEAQKFQKALRLAKDSYEQAKEESNNQTNIVSSSADELKKYSELFNSGAITQDEFNKIKQKYLNNP